MIISRTPFRVAFVGGGSDLPVFFQRSPGAVVSMTIDKYMYVTVSRRVDARLRIAYTRTELVESVEQVEHDIIREALRATGTEPGVEITTIANLSAGTGLGSSSSLSVGALNALHAFHGQEVPRQQLAREACELEIGALQRPIGKQDQYAAAFGGLNYMQFNPDGTVVVEPIACRAATKVLLSSRLMLFSIGVRGDNSSLLEEQSAATASQEDKFENLKTMAALAREMRDRLRQNDLDSFGELLDVNWRLKRQLTGGISSPQIDEWYEEARRAGALGGKIVGAGGGGFLLCYCAERQQAALVRRMLECGLPQLRVQLEATGSAIICNDS